MSTKQSNAATKRGVIKKVYDKMVDSGMEEITARDVMLQAEAVSGNKGIFKLERTRTYLRESGVKLSDTSNKRPYTKADDDAIIKGLEEGLSVKQIAINLERSSYSMNYRVSKLREKGLLPETDRARKVQEEAELLASIDLDDLILEPTE